MGHDIRFTYPDYFVDSDILGPSGRPIKTLDYTAVGTVLICAIRQNNAHVIRHMDRDRVDFNNTDALKLLPVLEALKAKHIRLAEIMMKMGAMPTQGDGAAYIYNAKTGVTRTQNILCSYARPDDFIVMKMAYAAIESRHISYLNMMEANGLFCSLKEHEKAATIDFARHYDLGKEMKDIFVKAEIDAPHHRYRQNMTDSITYVRQIFARYNGNPKLPSRRNTGKPSPPRF